MCEEMRRGCNSLLCEERGKRVQSIPDILYWVGALVVWRACTVLYSTNMDERASAILGASYSME